MNNNSNIDVSKMSLTTEKNLLDLFNEFKKEKLFNALKIEFGTQKKEKELYEKC